MIVLFVRMLEGAQRAADDLIQVTARSREVQDQPDDQIMKEVCVME